MRKSRSVRLLAWAVTGVALLMGAEVRAQDATPKFDYAKTDAQIQADKVEKGFWTAKAGAGVVYNSGNTTSLAVDAAGTIGYRRGNNKVQLDVGGSYVRTSVLAVPAGTTAITDQNTLNSFRTDVDSTKLWLVQLRYDRFFTLNNSAYLFGKVGGNEPGGKLVFGGAQIGYRRQIVQSKHHDFSGDLGVDYQYEHYVANAPDLHIGSLALNLRYALKITDSTSLSAEANLLMNLNPETVPDYIFNPGSMLALPSSSNVNPFEDTRLRASAALDTKLWKNLGFNFSFTAIYDNVPSPLPSAGNVTIFLPAQRLDTITAAKLTMTFL